MSQAIDNSKKFIKIVLSNKLATEEQVAECKKLQAQYPDKSVGQILVAKKYLSAENRAKIVKAIGGGSGASQRTPAQAADGGNKHLGAGDTIGKPISLDGPPKKDILRLLTATAQAKASDLHINVGSPPMLRLHGRIKRLNAPPLSADQTEGMLFALLNESESTELREQLDLDFTYELGDTGRFRGNIFKQQRGFDAAFRYVPKEVPSLMELGVPEIVEKMTHYTQGLTLITGPAGSGKTTTLAALIQLINHARKENIICLEEPIEYVIPSATCNVVQRQIPRDSLNFGNALRASLREDPDVIMIGEMRDKDTVSVAVTAAETGHLVLGSLHTSSAARTVDRVLDVFPPREAAQVRAMISESLRGVLAQSLVPRADNKGRVLACEIMFNTPAIGNLIRDSRTFQIPGVIQTGKKAGMQTMDDCLKELVKKRVITVEEAILRAENKANFQNPQTQTR